MKKIFGLVALSSVVLMALPAYAEDIVSNNSGEVKINGTLGVDNTVEDATIPEGQDAWINVTLPTDTIFYSTDKKANAPIASPDYTITNNSGRPVDILFKEIVKENPVDPAPFKYSVSLQGFTSTPKIIENGLVASEDNGKTIHTLANNNGKLGKDDPSELNTTANTVTFRYVGEVKDPLAEEDIITENYTMTLQFKAVSWPEDTP